MDLLNLCLKIPNLGILIYYLIFIVIIPYILISNYSISILRYYMPLMLVFAHLLTRVGNKQVFNNLYDLKPDNFVSFISTNFINLFALFGIIWQTVEYSKRANTDITYSVIYGILLFIISFPLARVGLKYILDNTNLYLKEKTNVDYKYNWHLIVIGLLYIIFILGLQAIVLSLVDISSLQRLNNIINKAPNKAPNVKAPNVKAPNVKAPNNKAPNNKAPNNKAPNNKGLNMLENISNLLNRSKNNVNELNVNELNVNDLEVPDNKNPNMIDSLGNLFKKNNFTKNSVNNLNKNLLSNKNKKSLELINNISIQNIKNVVKK